MAEQRSPKPQVVGSIPSWPALIMRNTMVKSRAKTTKDLLLWLLFWCIIGGAVVLNVKYQSIALPMKLIAGLVVVLLAAGGDVFNCAR